ncbi:unnamed protein product [Acanthoscelides obtectus]|uniref:Uncharacterized protein n=1 Tax=Acanthoscelides obtectus TaxID=200917 RepID=A0A9P0Q186_ACAOB|nr:unnamed protein product [Acanthoscelides obtectus]CAK1655559.1 hypothetical protein AOBTE_LOCUS19217 [Acanthoscelides obtectus]
MAFLIVIVFHFSVSELYFEVMSQTSIRIKLCLLLSYIMYYQPEISYNLKRKRIFTIGER